MSLSDQLRKLPGADSGGLMPLGLLSCATLIVLKFFSLQEVLVVLVHLHYV
jgi:hypothetical protein